MSRLGQYVAGTFTLLVGAGLLLGHYVVETHAPKDLELYIGLGLVVLATGLLSPVGFREVLQALAKAGKGIASAYRRFRGQEDASS